MSGFSVRLGRDRDLAEVRRLLSESGLPNDGLFDVPTTLLVVDDDQGLAGTVAVEEHGDSALLRSLVVEDRHRGRGIGSALVERAEQVARDREVDEVFLLTETAERFFSKRGYVVVDRDSAPPAVASSVEWSEACGDSAVAMKKGRDSRFKGQGAHR